MELTPTLNIVYVLTNSAMPGLVKVGKTSADDPLTRVSQLYTTGVPVPFTIEYACRVESYDEVERALHIAFGPQRINPRREFFEIEPEQVIAVLQLLSKEDATSEVSNEPDGIETSEKDAAKRLQRSRRPNLDFLEMGIPIGSVLHGSEDGVTARVTGPRKVEYAGEDMYLSKATRLMKGTDYNLNPGPYWSFNGKSVREYYVDTYSVEDE